MDELARIDVPVAEVDAVIHILNEIGPDSKNFSPSSTTNHYSHAPAQR